MGWDVCAYIISEISNFIIVQYISVCTCVAYHIQYYKLRRLETTCNSPNVMYDDDDDDDVTRQRAVQREITSISCVLAPMKNRLYTCTRLAFSICDPYV